MRNGRTLQELAQYTDSTLVGDPSFSVYGVSSLEAATARDASFLSNPKYSPHLSCCQAGVIFVDKSVPLLQGKNFLISSNPSLAFQKALNLFKKDSPSTGFSGIHETVVIHPSARIGQRVTIGPHSVIDDGVFIEDDCRIGPGCYLGQGVHLGKNCHIHAHVTLREGCRIGHRVIIQPGAVIGSCGFGYVTDATGCHTKLEQAGIVVIEDDVEIGANTTIDRARFDVTRIGRGSKIDNQVQIGHNVCIGPHNIIVAQSGLAGSCKTGQNVVLAGQSALVGHISIADRTILTARGALSKSVLEPGGKFAGAPATSLKEHQKQMVHLRNIEKLIQRVEALEEKMESLQNGE